MLRLALVPLAACAALHSLRAQCDLQWVSAGGSIGADHRVRAATLWDPDGAGPLPEHLVIGGDFSFVTDTLAPLLAMQDPQTGQWQSLGAGFVGQRVEHLAVLTTGELVASGSFTMAGGVAVNGLARFDGTSWSPLGAGVRADALVPLANGELLSASNSIPQSQWVGKVNRWNGSSWSQIAPDVGGRIAAMVVMPNGDIVVAGAFPSAGGIAASNIARFDGTNWAPLGGGSGGYLQGSVITLAVLANGDLVAGGYFTEAGGVPAEKIARWDGVAWNSMGSGVSAPSFPAVWSLRTLSNGDLIVGGYFDNIDGVTANCIARWSSGAWSPVGIGVDNIVDAIVEMANGDLVIGGAFSIISTGKANRLARWDGVTWSVFGSMPSCNDQVNSSAVADNGDLLLIGKFTQIGGVAANQVARRTASGWTPLGSGITGSVSTIAVLAGGDVVVGGLFSNAGGVPANNIARWDGTSWSPLGVGTSGFVLAMEVMPNGDLIAGGNFQSAGGQVVNRIARWDGATWSPLAAGAPGIPTCLELRPNGDLIVASTLGTFFSRIDTWDGATWTHFVDVPGAGVSAMTTMPNGDLMIGGTFSGLGGVASPGLIRWDGSTWSSMQLSSTSSVRTIGLLPDGDLVVGGYVVLGSAAGGVARWHGSSWTLLDSAPVNQVGTIAVLPQGEVVVGGTFSVMGGLVSPYFASLVTPCPATAVPFGAGCVGSNGLVELTSTQLPWLGSTFRTRANGLPQLSFAALITGFTPLAVPLNLLFAEAGVGCLGHTTAEHIELGLPIAGEVTSQIVVPNNPALVGATIHQYALAFEFDALGTLLAVTSSNGLTATLGRF